MVFLYSWLSLPEKPNTLRLGPGRDEGPESSPVGGIPKWLVARCPQAELFKERLEGAVPDHSGSGYIIIFL